MVKRLLILSALVAMNFAQRSPYAGRLPIGYPIVVPPTTTTTPRSNDFGNRFDDDNTSPTTTMRMPVEARGDKVLIDRIRKMHPDQQPFWYLNWQALEAERQKPQTYPQRPPGFADISSRFNSDWVFF